MAKLTATQLRAELSARLAGVVGSIDTNGLNAALDRSVRFIDSLASYTFLQTKVHGNIVASTVMPMPGNINLQKEAKAYINAIKLSYVPYSELQTYYTCTGLFPTAFAYDATASTFQKVTATNNGITDGVDITGTPGAPVLVTGIRANITSAFTTGTVSIGTTGDATLFDTAIAVTSVGDATLTLLNIPYTFVAVVRPRVTLAITGTGSIDIYYYYSQTGTQPAFILNASTTAAYDLFYTKMMTLPSTGNEVEIPEQWYDLILDVAQYQQMAKFGMALSEESHAYTKDRLMQFVREFNSTLGANVNINDEAIRNGG